VIKRHTKVGQVRPWSHSVGLATEDKKKFSATSNVCALQRNFLGSLICFFDADEETKKIKLAKSTPWN